MSRAVHLDGITKRFPGVVANDDVDLAVESGTIHALLGENGAGKTTTFYMIVGMVRPDAGRIFLGGEDITRLPMYRRARRGIGYLAQEASVLE